MSEHIIRGCNIDPNTGGWVLEFLTPQSDVRSTGLVLNHALLIPPEDHLMDLIDTIEAALATVLDAALERFGDERPAPEPDEAVGPYDNPLERA